jgi:hypothetical protein
MRKLFVLKFAVMFIGLIPFTTKSAIACICSEMFTPPCAAFERADLVFVGTVDRVTDQVKANGDRLPYMLAHFTAVKFLKGEPRKDIVISFTESDCDFKLDVKKEYFVYARLGASGMLELRRCDRTRLLEDAGPDLAYAKSLEEQPLQIFVMGAIASLSENDLKTVRVIVTGKHGSTECKITDRVFFNVRVDEPGRYIVRLVFPFKIKVADQSGIDLLSSSDTTVEYAVNIQKGRCGYREINFIEKI